MPYKNKEKQRTAMRKVMRKHRAKKKQQKEKARKELLMVFSSPIEIKRRLPNVADLIFGKELQKIAMNMDFGNAKHRKKPKKREQRKK